MTLPRRLTPDLNALQAFEAAARHGSFTRAAQELNLTQSAISRQIKDLETQMGLLLFERIRQRAVLSDAGKRFLPEARALLQQTENMMIRAVAGGAAKSVLSIATLPTFGGRWLTPRLPGFLRDNPGAVVNIASRSEPFDFDMTDFDLAVHFGQPVWAHARCTFLCSEIVVPVASPALIAVSPVRTPSDLTGQPLLHLTGRPQLWSQWLEHVAQKWEPVLGNNMRENKELERSSDSIRTKRALELEGVAEASAYTGHRFDQFSMLISAALAGMGFALLPRYLIEAELGAGDLVIVRDRPMTTENAYYVVIPEARNSTELSVRFQRWIQEQVPGRSNA
jgi:LysR family glycine cleavage system transcriptional activator